MYILVGILLVLVLVLAIRLYQYKRQIKDFIQAARWNRDMGVGRPVTVDCFDKDITELAKVLNEYTEMIKRLSIQYENDRKQLKNVIAGISHDFRTPLTAVTGYMQLMEKSEDLSEKDREYLDIAMKKVTYLKLLSDDFFEISSLEAKEEKLEVSRINVGNFLSECILQQYDWIKESGLRTDFRLPSEDVYVMTNEHDFKRIIENLFSNVRKYVGDYAGMQVICRETQVEIVMENDFAEGMVFDISQVFEPFYRSSARSNEGSGLGLYVVKCLADRLGYEVQAECVQGLFRFRMVMMRVI